MKKAIKIILIVFGVIIFLGWLLGDGMDNQVQKEIDHTSIQVARDAEKQYAIAKKNNEHMDAYIQAGLVAIAYLNAKDEANYKKWKKIEKEAAKKAGL
jgi:exonuclease III